ncbi:uncharacterized protein [Battus philenor]|uniref:uncharacterized protein n=1 Tax=Battus philenor TaxID=42288 RepID=UPI0035D07750
MDWLKLLTLLVAVASVQIKADGPKKKIRIHLPQTVKHIHHHKKIYITNHQASSQYAPAFMPSAEGAVAVSTNIALPAVTNILPLNSVDILEESVRVPSLTASASKLLPLYRARGYYGPTRTELEEQEYDIAPHAEPADSFIVPSVLSASQDSTNNSPKRLKMVKVSESPRKKVIRKVKPQQRAPVRKPAATVQDEERPVSTYHEQFYSDLQDASTIRKIKKPPRVEKIVDGNTEHIHTYSEEHIHKVVYDEEPKYAGVVGVEPIGAISTYGHSFIPFKNTQLVALASNPYGTLAVPGSMGTPSQYEYAAYNPREVTHDHIFHEHGELPEEINVNKDILSFTPKVSYNSQGLRLGSGVTKRIKSKNVQKPTRTPSGDYSYYENMFSSSRVKPTKSTAPTALYSSPQNENLNEFKPVSTYRYKGGISSKSRNKIPTYYGKPLNDYRTKQTVQTPYSVSSKIIHDFKSPQLYSVTPTDTNSLTVNQDQFANFKDSFGNNYEYDTYASSSNIHNMEENNVPIPSYNSKAFRKSRKIEVPSQNLFGTQNNVKYNNNAANDALFVYENDETPSALENMDNYDQLPMFDSITPTTYTVKESSLPHQYYTVKTLGGDQLSIPEASNNNYQYAEAPLSSTMSNTILTTTTSPIPQTQTNQINELTTRSPEFVLEDEQETRHKTRYLENDANSPPRDKSRGSKGKKQTENLQTTRSYSGKKSINIIPSESTERSKIRYGDKI